jgi:N6-L-threonylcarbamoyladenine synthase
MKIAKILAIETSCDETAISIVEGTGTVLAPAFRIHADVTQSQITIHEKWGGVVPNLAKREHIQNLPPILITALKESGLYKEEKKKPVFSNTVLLKMRAILEREPSLAGELFGIVSTIKKPKLDAIAVTYGPGLEPALWVGLNFAKALSVLWNIPLIPIDHMEGHILSVLLEEKGKKGGKGYKTKKIAYPALALLVSGGHTELVLIKKPLNYKIIGETRDDAVGEAFDKVARLLSLPYPGGPALSALGKKAPGKYNFKLPRPMLHSEDFDFSFSGLKTAVLYALQKHTKLTPAIKKDMARQFEDAVCDVLITKTLRAVKKYKVKTVLLGGGVAANNTLRERLAKTITTETKAKLFLPEKKFSTDNAVMIALSAYVRAKGKKIKKNPLATRAEGNLILS